MNNKYTLAIIILILIVGGGILANIWNRNKVSPTPSTSPALSTSPSISSASIPITKNNNTTYTTFFSKKADFTFEYPSNWVYDEREDSIMSDGKKIKTMAWGFYPNLENGYRNRPPYLEIHSPGYEIVDFFSFGYKGTKFPYQLNTFPTNDPETYVTYEQSEGGSSYIYWQKGEAFASARSINMDDFYQKVNLMVFYSAGEGQDARQIGKHIAQSIKIK